MSWRYLLVSEIELRLRLAEQDQQQRITTEQLRVARDLVARPAGDGRPGFGVRAWLPGRAR
ncbi:MAG: hypothetical protein ACRDTA_17185 [Pseudonocardiaceae bacterium]